MRRLTFFGFLMLFMGLSFAVHAADQGCVRSLFDRQLYYFEFTDAKGTEHTIYSRSQVTCEEKMRSLLEERNVCHCIPKMAKNPLLIFGVAMSKYTLECVSLDQNNVATSSGAIDNFVFNFDPRQSCLDAEEEQKNLGTKI